MSGIIVRCAILAGALGLLAASASAQVVSAPVITANPVGFAWNANDAAEKVVGYQLEIDQTVIDVGAVLNYATTIAPGSHAVQVRA
jgi:hypothetical protein